MARPGAHRHNVGLAAKQAIEAIPISWISAKINWTLANIPTLLDTAVDSVTWVANVEVTVLTEEEENVSGRDLLEVDVDTGIAGEGKVEDVSSKADVPEVVVGSSVGVAVGVSSEVVVGAGGEDVVGSSEVVGFAAVVSGTSDVVVVPSVLVRRLSRRRAGGLTGYRLGDGGWLCCGGDDDRGRRRAIATTGCRGGRSISTSILTSAQIDRLFRFSNLEFLNLIDQCFVTR